MSPLVGYRPGLMARRPHPRVWAEREAVKVWVAAGVRAALRRSMIGALEPPSDPPQSEQPATPETVA